MTDQTQPAELHTPKLSRLHQLIPYFVAILLVAVIAEGTAIIQMSDKTKRLQDQVSEQAGTIEDIETQNEDRFTELEGSGSESISDLSRKIDDVQSCVNEYMDVIGAWSSSSVFGAYRYEYC